MRYLSNYRATELSTGSMADIAFLLLTFYMMTTVIRDEKGIALLLPQFQQEKPQPLHDRNVFTIQLNSADQFMIEGEVWPNLESVREELKTFILNNDANPKLSESPQQAVVSFKTDRGTSYKAFIQTLDEIQGAYYEIYAARTGISPERFRKLDLSVPSEKKLYELGRNGIPMNISIAEPTKMR
jgi:biopolymer transport protein ExbD